VSETPRSPRRIRESLDAFARVQVSVSLEETVMARIRAAARRHPVHVGTRERAWLGGALAAGVAGEILAFVLVAVLVLPPLYALGASVGVPEESLRYTAEVLVAVVNLLLVLGSAAGTIVSALGRFVPPGWMVAAAFIAMLSFSTFVAVRRDLRRTPATGGMS